MIGEVKLDIFHSPILDFTWKGEIKTDIQINII